MLTFFFKKFLLFFKEKRELKEIHGIEECLSLIDAKNCLVIGSDFYIDNKEALNGLRIVCIDSEVEEFNRNRYSIPKSIKHDLVEKVAEFRGDFDMLISCVDNYELVSGMAFDVIIIKG